METGSLYKVSDIKLDCMTLVIVEKDIDSETYLVSEVIGRLPNDSLVEYQEACINDEWITYHKVIYRGRVCFIVENKKYGKVELRTIHLRLMRAA